jgi:8-amino-7-oxononanoate synthase
VSWISWAADRCDSIQELGRWRAPRDLDAFGPAGRREGQHVVSFASNDYLGLTAHPAVIAAAHDALDRWGAGSGSARLIVGSRPVHTELERELAEWKAGDAAALFPTGFAANLGVLTALATDDVTVCSDELNHASIIDGCRLARARGAELVVWPHGELEPLATALATAAECGRRTIVVSDTVFSMDGDEAQLEALAALCVEHRALLVLDEAHAVLAATIDPGTLGCDLLRVGTLSKTLGSLGGFVAGPKPLVDLVVNTSRPYIFTTAPTPADSAAALAALRVLRSDEGAALVARLRMHVDRVAGPAHPSPIVPVVIGGDREALEASDRLLAHGLVVPAIRPPTVAPGTARLRVTLSAAHTDAHVDRLMCALGHLGLSRAP